MTLPGLSQCPQCGYCLFGRQSRLCPECGLTDDDMRTLIRQRGIARADRTDRRAANKFLALRIVALGLLAIGFVRVCIAEVPWSHPWQLEDDYRLGWHMVVFLAAVLSAGYFYARHASGRSSTRSLLILAVAWISTSIALSYYSAS